MAYCLSCSSQSAIPFCLPFLLGCSFFKGYLESYLLASWNFDVRDTSRTCFNWSKNKHKSQLTNEITRFFRSLTSKFYKASKYNFRYIKKKLENVNEAFSLASIKIAQNLFLIPYLESLRKYWSHLRPKTGFSESIQ